MFSHFIASKYVWKIIHKVDISVAFVLKLYFIFIENGIVHFAWEKEKLQRHTHI